MISALNQDPSGRGRVYMEFWIRQTLPSFAYKHEGRSVLIRERSQGAVHVFTLPSANGHACVHVCTRTWKPTHRLWISSKWN